MKQKKSAIQNFLKNKSECEPKIVNIVATGNFSKRLNINSLARNLDVEEKIYDPETYPALLVKVGKNKKHVTLYSSGKYIIVGVTSKKELFLVYKEIVKKLKKAGALNSNFQ
ncbi:MAG: hypothetical protein NT016_00530 [Candidatus Aenigmarchaeota archaeon]|nr:hypothetical protein [Candidatus Aenigmarchaeota archaeon]